MKPLSEIPRSDKVVCFILYRMYRMQEMGILKHCPPLTEEARIIGEALDKVMFAPSDRELTLALRTLMGCYGADNEQAGGRQNE